MIGEQEKQGLLPRCPVTPQRGTTQGEVNGKAKDGGDQRNHCGRDIDQWLRTTGKGHSRARKYTHDNSNIWHLFSNL